MKCFRGLALWLMLALLPALGLAQAYYTLPEIREQAAAGWHETYTDKYGREIAVDVNAEVYGGENAPVLQVKPVWYSLNADLLAGCEYWRDGGQAVICHNNPADAVFGARSGEKTVTVYRSCGERVDMDAVYGEEYGAVVTMREMTERLHGVLQAHGISAEHYLFAQPKAFSVRCKIKSKSGEVVAPGMYMAHFWQQMYGLPILASIGEAFEKPAWPEIGAEAVFTMRDADSYSATVSGVEEMQKLAEDVPLCAFERVRDGLAALIEAGHVRRVFDVKLGYVAYNDPDCPEDLKSIYDAPCYYLVPAWVAKVIYVDQPGKDYAYRGMQSDELVPDEKNVAEYKTVIIHAQTGEVIDRANRESDRADYKGFLSWDDVK